MEIMSMSMESMEIMFFLDRSCETPCVILLSPIPAMGLGACEGAMGFMGAVTRRWNLHPV